MLDTFFGLPTHILVIHAVVVLIPLAALVTIAVAVVPSWRARFVWWVAALDLVTFGASLVAKESGESLYHRLQAIGAGQSVHEHTELGDVMPWFVLGLLIVAVLLGLVRHTRRGAAPLVLAALAVAVGVASVVWVVRVGHSGSGATWSGIVASTNGKVATGGDDGDGG